MNDLIAIIAFAFACGIAAGLALASLLIRIHDNDIIKQTKRKS